MVSVPKPRSHFGAMLLVSILAVGMSGGAQSRWPRPEDVVKSRVYVSLAPVPQGQTFEVALVGEVRRGFHINSNQPREEFLIPTTLDAQLPEGWKLLSAKFPAAKNQKFPFSEKEMAVYDGSFTVRLKLQAAANAPLGPVKLPLVLRYQACNDEACLPPVKIPLVAELEIAPVGTKGKPQNQEVFSRQ
jgi:thiol:disulfide interchange protein DsbD